MSGMKKSYKKKVQIGDCTLYLGDSMEILPTLDKVVAVVTDPPYNILGLGGGGFGSAAMYSGNKIDKWCDFDVFKHIGCLLQSQKTINGFFFCSRLGIQKYLLFAHENKLNYDVLCWYKRNAIPFTNGTMKQDLEYIIRLYSDKEKIEKGNKQHRYSKLFDYPTDSSRDKGHPTKKPIAIMERLVELLTKKGDLVLDGYMGSGSTIVACAKMGRKGIGIEIEEDYFNIACKRVEAAYAQSDLFTGAKKKETAVSLELF